MCTVPLAASAQEPVGRKGDRSAVEQKMDSALIDLTRAAGSGQLRNAASRQALPAYVQDFAERHVAPDQTIFVVIKGKVSDALTAFIRSHGGSELSAFPQYDTITARVPVSELSAIANRSDVRTIGPREEATTNRLELPPEVLREKLKNLPQPGAATNAGSVTWQGVAAHKANVAHAAGRTGAGTKVCVLSDGVASLAARQATGDLPATVTVLPGQAGPASGDEGTAMLEIVHDMAPGASLVYATGFTGVAQFATNIINLRNNAGCDIIVDDVTYFNEGAFQDGPIAQAVNQVTAAGALYFSSAANSGNKSDSQSGTFEGNFVASGNAIPTAIQTLYGATPIQLQAFGSNNYTALTASTYRVSLKWSDPLGGSSNDYDLIVTNAAGTVVLGQSTGSQSGTQDPYELAPRATPYPIGSRIYIVRYSGAARALRLDTHRGRITPADSTAGSTFGHNAAASGISVAAVPLATATGPGGTFTGGVANPVETYSSDGPRKMFYHPNGTAITPGNVLFPNGGITLQKVDMAAGDCGTTTTPGFIPFCGTSAAAPTAAAIAALIKGANPGWTNAQIVAAMNASALDIEAAGWDRDSGVGIVMVPASLSSFTIGGSVSGLGAGKSVVLHNNGGDALTRNANGSFSFATALASGASYAVTVGTQPAGQTCTVSNGSGTVAAANVTNVAVSCVDLPPATYTIGGNLSGLGAGKSVVLHNNGGDALTRNANGGFSFATALASGATYSVTVGTQPVGQTCTVSNGSGTVASANVTNVAVSCANVPTYTIGGSVSGLVTGRSVGLLNNGGDALTVNANGGFSFATALASGASYAVTVGTQPAGQVCTVNNGSGTVASANVTNVAVSCVNMISGPTSTGTGTGTATLTGGGAACGFNAGSAFVGTPAAPPAGVTFPHGFFGFTASSCPAANGAVTVTLTYPAAIPPGAQYYKYGKEAGNTTDHYYTIPATISGNQVTFTITDGLLGDNDLAANGTITDPGAIGIAGAAGPAVTPIPTVSEYVLAALAMLMLLAAASPLRARRGTRR